MAQQSDRDLTSLEYIVLGLIGSELQTGYSIVTFFDAGASSYSASPGSIYPMLKRLEKRGVIAGTLEMEYETRPRKVYTLTAEGEAALNEWLHVIPKMRPYYEQRELAMWRFQFMEGRLDKMAIIRWLQDYLDVVNASDRVSRQYSDGVLAAMDELGQDSLHRQLVIEANIMEINTMRAWLEMALRRMVSVAQQTGEYKAVDDGAMADD